MYSVTGIHGLVHAGTGNEAAQQRAVAAVLCDLVVARGEEVRRTRIVRPGDNLGGAPAERIVAVGRVLAQGSRIRLYQPVLGVPPVRPSGGRRVNSTEGEGVVTREILLPVS